VPETTRIPERRTIAFTTTPLLSQGEGVVSSRGPTSEQPSRQTPASASTTRKPAPLPQLNRLNCRHALVNDFRDGTGEPEYKSGQRSTMTHWSLGAGVGKC